MGRLHILPQGYHWMEFGHEDRGLKIIVCFIFASFLSGNCRYMI